MEIHTIVTRILFIGLLPLSFYWLRIAYRIAIKKDYSYVALKRGIPPENPKRFAIYSIGLNFIAGSILIVVFFLVIIVPLDYETWTAIVGPTIWMKLFAEFILSRQAHIKRK